MVNCYQVSHSSMRILCYGVEILHLFSIFYLILFLKNSLIGFCNYSTVLYKYHYSLVSFAAVIRVVTQRSSPITAAHSSSAFLSLKLTNYKEETSIFWKPGPSSGLAVFLAANVTRIWLAQLLTITCMLLVLSNKGKGMQSSNERLLVGRIVTWRP